MNDQAEPPTATEIPDSGTSCSAEIPLRDRIFNALDLRIADDDTDNLTDAVMAVVQPVIKKLRANVEAAPDAATWIGRCVECLTQIEGGVDMQLEPARELAAIWVAAARTMLGDAENYSETPVEIDVGLGVDPDNPKPRELYTVVIQRVGKVTPHQARKRAEAERDRAVLAKIAHAKAVEEWRREAEDLHILLREAAAALNDLGACNDPACPEPGCSHILTRVRPALGLGVQRAEQAEAELAKVRGWSESLTRRMGNDIRDYKLANTRMQQLITTRTEERDQLQARAERAEALLPQLEAAEEALDRIKHLAINTLPTGCGAGWDLDPASILAAIANEPEGAT